MSTSLSVWNSDCGAHDVELTIGDRSITVPWTYEWGGQDVAAEISALDHVGIVDRGILSAVELVGEDRARFLNGLVTLDVVGLEEGSGGFAFVTDIKGRVLAEAAVFALDDRIWLEVPHGRSSTVVSHLERYVVADRVQPRPLGDMQGVGLVGHEVPSALEELGGWPPTPWSTMTVKLGGSVLQVSRLERLGIPAANVWIPSSIAPDSINELVSLFQAKPIGHGAVEALRTKAGLSRWGIDYGDSNLPQESSIAGIDFEKGCYLGQEIIARLHYRGQAPKRVSRLSLDEKASARTKLRSCELLFEGRPAGNLTSWVRTSDRPDVALGMVARRAWEAGTPLEVAGGGHAEVIGPAS